jgi:hypothetical protein
MDIVGDVGTNGLFKFSGTPGITGDVFFHGEDAGWYADADPGAYDTHHMPSEMEWKTVEEIALEAFPNSGATAPGGLTYLKTHNSNASAIPPIASNSITDTTTLTGPGDYYLENVNLTGTRKIILNNAAGPIRIWLGPKEGTGTFRWRGGTGAIAGSESSANKCTIYMAAKSTLDLAGNERLDASIYAYNEYADGTPYGNVLNSGTPTINGQILANKVDLNGNITVNYVPSGLKPTNFGYYGFDDSWKDMTPR